MTPAERHERFWAVVRRGIDRAEVEDRERVARLRPARRTTKAQVKARMAILFPQRHRDPE